MLNVSKPTRNTIMEKKLNIGDFVKYRSHPSISHFTRKSHRGQIIDIIEPYICPNSRSPEPGSITIVREDGSEFIDYHYIDYHYIFELDIEKMRERKLNSILLSSLRDY